MLTCQGDSGALWICRAYLHGFLGGYVAGDRTQSGSPFVTPNTVICHPDPYRGDQLVAIFVKWAEAHPGLWHIDQSAGVLNALKAAWPCP
jgi:hypothetical protein